MDMQKFADRIKEEKNKMFKVFPSGKMIVASMAAGAAVFALGGKPNVTEATDGRPTEKTVEMNTAHIIGLLAMGLGGTLAMKDGFEYGMNEDKKGKKTRSAEEFNAYARKVAHTK